MNSAPLPFDALRPFKSRPEEFEPRDTLPWETHAINFLNTRSAEGFTGLRTYADADAYTDWIVGNLGLPAQARVLDIGCGPGLYSNRLAARGCEVVGIDIAQDFLDYATAEAAEHGWPARYENISLFAMPYESEFDLVLLLQSIVNRVTPQELDQIMGDIWRALKPGGHFICEFMVASEPFRSGGETVEDKVSLVRRSPWSDQLHLWMVRELMFPERAEWVTHHLILRPEVGRPEEFWSRFTMHEVGELRQKLIDYGFVVEEIFGQDLGRPLDPADAMAVVWVSKPAA
jgi:SAM-dependent methyltransferase